MEKHYELNVSDWAGYLKSKGLQFLTGEACNVGLRQLWEVTEEGHAILEAFFSVGINLSPPMNRGYGTILLNRNIVCPSIVTFALLQEYPVVLYVPTQKFETYSTNKNWKAFSSAENFAAHRLAFPKTYGVDGTLLGHYRVYYREVTNLFMRNPHGRSGRLV